MEKYFDQDKNYILKQAQLEFKARALDSMVSIAIDSYLAKHNPLGLVDDFVLELTSCKNPSTDFLYKPYQLLAAVYRLLHSDNQLTFSWEGKSHHDLFTEEWQEAFTKWMEEFCMNSYMDKIIIKGAVISPQANSSFLEAQLNKLIYQRFPVKKSRQGALVAA